MEHDDIFVLLYRYILEHGPPRDRGKYTVILIACFFNVGFINGGSFFSLSLALCFVSTMSF